MKEKVDDQKQVGERKEVKNIKGRVGKRRWC